MPLRPTHTCFDDAIDFLELLPLDKPQLRDDILRSFQVAHGFCVSSTGVPYVHAWIEELVSGDPERITWPAHVVWQGYLRDNGRRGYFAVPASWFYTTFGVFNRELYSLEQVAQHNLATGHYGPWRRDFFEHAQRQGGGGRVLGSVDGVSPLGFIEP